MRQVGVSQSGIIPAYAGNTITLSAMQAEYWDHPRICGEHMSSMLLCSSTPGSSPHMRGTQYRMVFATPVCGIIPAYAGNTLRDYSNFVVSKFMSFVFHLV